MSENHPAQNGSAGEPDEVERLELLRFAEDLKASRPQLSSSAMETIAGAMRREIAIQKRAATIWPSLAAAAAIFIMIGTALISASFIFPTQSQPPNALSISKEADRDLERGRRLMETFAKETNFQNKLALLPEIAQHCADTQLSSEARYLVALQVLRAHLTWHESYDPPEQLARVEHLKMARNRESDEQWAEAHGGADWLISESAREQASDEAKKRQQNAEALEELQKATQPPLFWRLTDPKHPDVSRAIALLNDVRDGRLQVEARRWAFELARNNTVLTFDVSGSYTKGEAAPVVIDARCADTLSLKLYRVRKPELLVAVSERIGKDFIFRDYGLPAENLYAMEKQQARAVEVMKTDKRLASKLQTPQLDPRDLVATWETNVSELKVLRNYSRDRWEDDDADGAGDDAEAQYFGDACDAYRDRLQKSYVTTGTPSTWQCNRILNVPAKALTQDGAYILVAEANGQKAYAPVLVNALSLTLRRCRDGVFVLVSDAAGAQSAVGAKIMASEMLGEAVADKSGAAFARVFAAGDKPIVASCGDQFAIGGFGRLFDGIYKREFGQPRFARMQALQVVREVVTTDVTTDVARVYADRHVVAAHTDRPTYRPGQEVQFKLIVRRLKTADQKESKANVETEFRADDFEFASQLSLPTIAVPLKYDVINPRGRSVANGQLELNDFGTAAGKFELSSEDATGAYSLRVWLGERSYIVPDAFAVKYYRRSNFEVDVAGVPETVKPRQVLKLHATARYYFGKPVANGRVDARLVRQSDHQLVVEASADLTAGAATLDLSLPDNLAASQFLMITTVTDESGRAVSKSSPCRSMDASKKVPSLSELPRFVAAGETFKVSFDTADLVARQISHDKKKKLNEERFKTVGGIATVTLKTTGWHTLSSGNEAFDIFVYGGEDDPFATAQRQTVGSSTLPRWVNLSNYEYEEDHNYDSQNGCEMYALFDRQYVRAGDKLRLLVYAPFKRARLLFTIEGRTVSDYHVTWSDSASHYHVVDLPVKTRHAPNFYLQGRILAGEKEGQSLQQELAFKALEILEAEIDGEDPRWCRIDVLDSATASGTDKLKISVQPDRQDYRPGENVKVAIHVTDLAGNPREAEVSLSAVDESIYEFGEDRSSLLAQCFEKRRSAERYYRKTWRCSTGDKSVAMQKLHEMAQAMASQKALDRLSESIDKRQPSLMTLAGVPSIPLASLGQMPAGTVPLGYLRTDFRETAAWQPQLRSGIDGKISTSFKLPDSLTAWRLNAVGLTRQTEIGSARAAFRTRQPLAAQLFLPRFAVEKDRLQLSAIVHNDGAAPRICQVLWTISGARVESWADPAVGGTVTPEGDTSRCTASVTVPAHGTARAAVWVRTESAGTLTVKFSVAEGADNDGEQREIPIRALGRAREVALQGTFENETSLKLPAGFVADDLRVSLARGSASQGLSGIAYLVDYPYGCVEQTMSRFLPAVMVAHASRNGPVELPADIQKKLPDVLSKGLARLYNFQHSDGGWGWWENDKTSNQMTVYVLYGLARCAGTGTKINSDCLSRASNYLLQNLRNGELLKNPGPFLHDGSSNTAADLESAAWLALALAGKAPADELKRFTEESLKRDQSQSFRCNLALACKSAGLIELGEKLRQTTQNWSPKSPMETTLKLRTEIAFGAPLAACNVLADELLSQTAKRSSTRVTSATIEALSELLAQMELGEAAQAFQIEARGHEIFRLTEGAGLKKMFHSVKASHEMIRGEELQLKLTAKCPEKIHYSIHANGTQRLDKIEPFGTDVRLLRTYSKLDGTPVKGPLAAGEFIAVKLQLNLSKAQSYIIVEDHLPAGWEFADDRLSGTSARLAANVEFRDDRISAFFTELPAGEHELFYYLRAEMPGTVNVLPGCAYPMYSETQRGETGSATLEVK